MMNIDDLENDLNSVVDNFESNIKNTIYSNGETVTFNDLQNIIKETRDSLKTFKTSIVQYLREK